MGPSLSQVIHILHILLFSINSVNPLTVQSFRRTLCRAVAQTLADVTRPVQNAIRPSKNACGSPQLVYAQSCRGSHSREGTF